MGSEPWTAHSPKAKASSMNFEHDSRFAGVSAHAPTAPVSAPASFVLCPVMIGANAGWAPEMYRLAYERAREAVARPWFERLFAPAAN